jgi:hypothetical protein
MKKQQTAVEWLIEKHFGDIENCTPDFRKRIEVAKQIEKEQIEDAYKNGWNAGDFGSDCWEEAYYNETFKKQ